MWYGIRMDSAPEDLYVASLRWRRGDLQQKLDTVGAKMQALTDEEAQLRQQMRAVDQLLAAAHPEQELESADGAAVHAGSNGAVPGGGQDSAEPTPDFTAWGPTARRIYACAEEVIREAGVPLHYRVLADEIQKKVALSGGDPGATLIAHLHRAQEVFPRVGRGVYGLAGMTQSISTGTDSVLAPTATRRRRPKTRRRTR